MTCSMDTTQPLFPATPVIAQWSHEQSGHCGRDGGYEQAQHHGLPLTKADLAMATAECPICQQQRPKLSPQFGTIPQGDQPATWRQVDYIRPLPSWQEQSFVLTGIDTYSACGFVYPARNASAKTLPSVDSRNALSTIIVFHTALLLTKALTLPLKKCSMGFCPLKKCSSGSSLVLLCFPLSSSSWIERMVEWPFEVTITMPSR
uniref:uncharacterized protein LOC128928685 n=1 Tax=Callithrix jacchus TaxID=9483 RepID=UPI0023DD3E38|nr:uncharacterized protein LOC128928685 [Callithrix jacchus]